MRKRGWQVLALCFPVFCLPAQTQTVWQIGKFDQSPVEFSRGAGDSASFNVEKDKPGDWPGRQRTGHPYRILFPLEAIQGSYSLKIATLIDQPRVPALRIEVNGHSGTFFLHPKLSYARSDFSYAFDPHESQSTLDIQVPSSFLKRGDNSITITCVDDPPTSAGEEEIGGISYDALSFRQDSSAGSEPATKIDVEPTILYRQTPAGLSEVVNAYIRFGRPWKTGTADLDIGGRHYTASLAAGEFGEERVSFDVPEWRGTAKGRIRIAPGTNRTFDVSLTPERKWTIYVVPHTHLDVGYTDYQGKVAETQARVLTQAGNLIHEHPDFRFSMDGSWNLEQLLNTRPKSKRDEILNLIRSGKMAMPAQNCNLLTGYASLETL